MSSFFMLFLALALLSKSQADLIGDFCSKSNNPSLCKQTLTSDPRSQGANARGLAAIALDKAESATKAAITVAKSVSNPGIKQIIDTCVENFDNEVGSLEESRPLIQKADRGSIGDLQTKGSAALTDVDTCSDEFGAKEPPQLKDASAKAYTFVQLLLIIVNSF